MRAVASAPATDYGGAISSRRPRNLRLVVVAVVAFALFWLVAATGTATFRGQNGLIAFRSDAGNTAARESHAIWVVKPDGTDASKVTPGASPPNGETDYSPVFLPDGRRFAYISQVFDENFSVKNQIYVKSVSAPPNARGTPVLPEAVTYRILSLGISPDGRELVLAAEPPPLSRTQIFLVSLDDGGMTQPTWGRWPPARPSSQRTVERSSSPPGRVGGAASSRSGPMARGCGS